MKCPVCGVTIEEGVVYFSYGQPGSKERLYARVCSYISNQECINSRDLDPAPKDYYSMPTNLTDWRKEIDNGNFQAHNG